MRLVWVDIRPWKWIRLDRCNNKNPSFSGPQAHELAEGGPGLDAGIIIIIVHLVVYAAAVFHIKYLVDSFPESINEQSTYSSYEFIITRPLVVIVPLVYDPGLRHDSLVQCAAVVLATLSAPPCRVGSYMYQLSSLPQISANTALCTLNPWNDTTSVP